MHHFIYLASASPRRAQLLEQMHVQHRPLLADSDENVKQMGSLDTPCPGHIGASTEPLRT